MNQLVDGQLSSRADGASTSRALRSAGFSQQQSADNGAGIARKLWRRLLAAPGGKQQQETAQQQGAGLSRMPWEIGQAGQQVAAQLLARLVAMHFPNTKCHCVGPLCPYSVQKDQNGSVVTPSPAVIAAPITPYVVLTCTL